VSCVRLTAVKGRDRINGAWLRAGVRRSVACMQLGSVKITEEASNKSVTLHVRSFDMMRAQSDDGADFC
jgi:hypothetical protein